MTSGQDTVDAVRWALEVGMETVMSFQEGGSTDDHLRLVIERNGGKSRMRKCQVTDTGQHRFGADVRQRSRSRIIDPGIHLESEQYFISEKGRRALHVEVGIQHVLRGGAKIYQTVRQGERARLHRSVSVA